MMPRERPFVHLLLIACVPAVAAWQVQPGVQDGLVKVQQGVADVGPLNVDLRVQPLDLRLPQGFESVYQGQTTDAYGSTTEYFARMNGAVTAVFPRSVYAQVAEGVSLAAVPPGTMYYIGPLPASLTETPRPGRGAGMPDAPATVGTERAGVRPRPDGRPAVPQPDGLSEAPFDPRVERLAAGRRAEIAGELIRRAAEAEKSRARGLGG